MSDPEYVAIGHAARVIGVPGKTVRRWVAAGTLPVVAGPRKRVVRLEDARRLAALTGNVPDTAGGTGAAAGEAIGHMAEGVGDDTMPPSPGAGSPAARSQLKAIRDAWRQSFIDQLREAERTIGRLEAERDQLRDELTAARATHEDAAQDASNAPTASEQSAQFWSAPAGTPMTLRAWIRRLVGRS